MIVHADTTDEISRHCKTFKATLAKPGTRHIVGLQSSNHKRLLLKITRQKRYLVRL